MSAPRSVAPAPVALVTGASSGLGAEFARQLAAEGRDLVLSARRLDRLEALAADLRGRHGVAVTVIAADLADPAGPDRLAAAVDAAGLTVDTLINNAGLGHRGPFAERKAAALLRIVDVNVRALVALTHAILPGMVARGRGSILNVASTAAFQAGPWMATYAASKAFVLSFSEALHEEVRPRGVAVVALCPGPVETEFGEVAGLDDMAGDFRRVAISIDRVVRDGLAALRRNRAVRVPGVLNAIGAGAVRVVPRRVARRVAGAFHRPR